MASLASLPAHRRQRAHLPQHSADSTSEEAGPVAAPRGGSPGLLALGAPAVAAQLQQAMSRSSQNQAGPGSSRAATSAGGGGSGRRAAFHNGGVQLEQVGEAIDAVVTMQPLPTTTLSSSAPPSVLRAPPPQLPLESHPPEVQPPQHPHADCGLGGAAVEDTDGSEGEPAELALLSSSSSSAENGGGSEVLAALLPLGEREEEEGGATSSASSSYRSVASDPYYLGHYESAASSGPARSDSISSGGSPSSVSSPGAAAAGRPWPEVLPMVEPPPRPSAAGQAASGGSSPRSGSIGAMASGQPEGQPQQQATPAHLEESEEGLQAPPPTPATPSALRTSPAMSAAVPFGALPTWKPCGGKATAVTAPAGPSAPNSPATPFAVQQAQPWLQPEQQQEGAEPASAGAATPGSWLGAISPFRLVAAAQQSQGAWVPERRSRLAVSATEAGGVPAVPSEASWVTHAPPPLAQVLPEGTSKQAQAAGTGESCYVPPTRNGMAAAEPSETAGAPAATTAATESSRVGQQQQKEEEQEQEQQRSRSSDSSADEPQLTEIRGPWPPRPPLPEQQQQQQQQQQQSAASPQDQLQQQNPSWGGGIRSAFQECSQQAASPRFLDDGTWEQPGGKVDWEESGRRPAGSGGVGAAGIEEPEPELLHDSLVDAAANSPPLSPITARLLSMKHHSAELRRGPHRAASLAPGLANTPERQSSMLCPERENSTIRGFTPPASPVRATLPPPPPPPSDFGLLRRSLQPQQLLLPVLNASPDVAASSYLPAPASPFTVPAADAASPGGRNSSAGRYGGIGGLPLDLVDKQDSRHHGSGAGIDLSPREAYSSDEERALLRQPLLPPSTSARLDGSPAGGADLEQGGWGAGNGGAGRGSQWASTALLASSMLGVGLVAAPRALALLGLVAGGIGLAAAVLLSFMATHCLLAAGSATAGATGSCSPPRSYAGAVRAALGPTWAVLADIALALNCFGLTVAGLVVMGDILVGGGGSGADAESGLLGGWGGDRATALAVVGLVVLLPLTSFRGVSGLAGTATLAVSASAMWAPAILSLALISAHQHATNRLHDWPSWRQLSGGGGGSAGWFAATVELVAVAPVLLLPTLCHVALHPVQRAHLRPGSAAGMRGAAGTALLYSASMAALLAVCCCALFGRAVQADVLADITPAALVSLTGEPAGHAAYLLIQLAFLVCIIASFPLLVGPLRDTLWSLLFWQPLLPGPGLLLVTLLALAAALWASLQAPPLWQLLSLIGGTTGALLALVLPGLAGLAAPGGGAVQTVGGSFLVALGVAVLFATATRLALYPSPA